MSLIFIIVALFLLLEIIVAKINIQYAVSVMIALLLLIPSVIKYSIGFGKLSINFNLFNLSVFIFLFFSLHYIYKAKNNLKSMKKILIVYLLYTVITTVLVYEYPFSEYIHNMILYTIEFFVMAYCLMYIRINEKAIKCFDITLLITSIIIVIYGFINYKNSFNPYMAYVASVTDMETDMSNTFQEEQRGIIMGRVSSTFIHPLQLGQCALLIFSYMFYQLKGKLNWVFWVVYLLGLAAMCVLCGSRSAIVPMLFVPLIYILFMKPSKSLRYVILIIFVVGMFYPALPKKTRTTIEGLVFVWDKNAAYRSNIGGSSIEGRSGQLKTALHIIDDNIFFGKGEGYVRCHGSKHVDMYGYESIVLKYLVNGGVVGLLAFCVFYFSLYWELLKRCNTTYDKARTHSLCLPFFISILLTGVSYSFFTLYMIFYFMTYYNIINRQQLSQSI